MTDSPQARGKILAEWRAKRYLKHSELADELRAFDVDVGAGYLRKLESGERDLSRASLKLRKALQQILRIPPEEWEPAAGYAQSLSVRYVGDEPPLPRYGIRVSRQGKGELVKNEHEFGEAVEQGSLAIYKVEGDGIDITYTVRRQDYAEPGKTIVCRVPEHGVLVAKFIGELAGVYTLHPVWLDNPIMTKHVEVMGVVTEIREALES